MPLQFNTNAARFRDPLTGQFITRDAVRAWIDRLISASQQRITVASEGLRNGRLTIGEWQAVMRTEIKDTQLASEALVRGGWAQMTPADFGRVGRAVRTQYAYLDRFTKQLQSGDVKMDGSFFNRAQLYAGSARVNFHEAQTAQLADLGYDEERNVLHPAEHCGDCVDMTSLGWVPVGTVIPIGSRQCFGNDRCSMRYRVGGG